MAQITKYVPFLNFMGNYFTSDHPHFQSTVSATISTSHKSYSAVPFTHTILCYFF